MAKSKKPNLNESNYYSLEMDKKYMSNSLLKKFQECEYKAMKFLNGELEDEKTTAMLVGQYVDEALTGTKESFDKFCNDNPEIFSSRGATKGLLKSEFQRANQMIEVAKADKKFMSFVNGQHQVIMTGEIFGVPIKIKMDSYYPHKAIVDLKTVESATKGYWNKDLKTYETFVEHFNYIQQLAIYQEIVRQNTGETLPCVIAYISKEVNPDHDLLFVDNETLHTYLFGNEFNEGLASQLIRAWDLTQGKEKPIKCGCCDVCMKEKKVEKPIHYTELLGRLN